MPIKLYRDFFRVLKKMPFNYRESMKRELRHHFEGNSLRQSDTPMDIKRGYRLLQMLKDRCVKKK